MSLATPRLWLAVFVFLVALASASQMPSSTAEIKSPDLNLIVQRLEDVQHQNPAQSQEYEVTREYKVFHGNDKQPRVRASENVLSANWSTPFGKANPSGKERDSWG
jgi:hypothetical protein